GSQQGDDQRGTRERRLPRAAEAGADEPIRGLRAQLDGRRLPRVAGGGRAQGRPLNDPDVDHLHEIVGAAGARTRLACRGHGPGDDDLSRGNDLLHIETPKIKSEQGPHVHGFGNPHYWLDPANARPMTRTILEALARRSPDGREIFARNRARFLERLDASIARWTHIMAAHRGARVVVYHDSWPYFARRFGLVVVATVEPVPGVPPSPASLAALTTRM